MFYRGYEKMNTRISVLQYLFYLGAGLAAIALFNGTGDAGDSITHYLYARYAPQHPMAFLIIGPSLCLCCLLPHARNLVL